MARKFLTPIDLSKNEIQNAVLQVLASAPGTPNNGQMYFDSVAKRPKFYDLTTTTWIDPTARSSHTGTQVSATISDLSTTVQAYRLDQFAAPTADLSLNSHKLTNVTDGVSAQDAVTMNQLNQVLQSRSFKDAVRFATTAALTLATGFAAGQVVDGVTIATGDRFLNKNAATASENGIYTANSSGAPTRATDADATSKLKEGTTVMVAEGTANADKQFTLTTTGTITVGTTAQTWAQTGAGTTYTQGTGISIAGSVISIDTTVTARKFAQAIGDGSSTSIAVTHSLGTVDVNVQVRDASTGALVDCDNVANSTSQVTLSFAVAPASNAYRVVVIG